MNNDYFNLNYIIRDKIGEIYSEIEEIYSDYDYNFEPFIKPEKKIVDISIIRDNTYDDETYDLILSLLDRYNNNDDFNDIDLDILNKLITKKIDINQIKDEIKKCKEDVVYFANNYLQVKNKAEEGGYFVNKNHIFGDKVKYKMFKIHKYLADSILNNDYVIGVKSRQIGFTTCVGALSIHKIIFENNKTILVISKAYEEAKKTLEEQKFMYINLPFFMRRSIYKDNMGQFALGNKYNFSSIEVKTSGKRSGRSIAATWLILDEAEFILNIDELQSAAAPTLSSTKGKCIVLSTPYEYKSQFYDLVSESLNSDTWKLVIGHQSFIPGRDDKQYSKQKILLNNDPEKIKTELDVQWIIPSDKYIDESYLKNVKNNIDIKDLSIYADTLDEPLKSKFKNLIYSFDYIEFYNYPELSWDLTNKQIDYIFAFDPCEGGTDKHGISMIKLWIENRDSTQYIGYSIEFLGKTNEMNIIDLIELVNEIYPDLKIIIERNKGFKYLDILDKENKYILVDEISLNKTMDYYFKSNKKGIFLTEYVRKKIMNLIYNYIIDNHNNGIEKMLYNECIGLKYKNRRIEGENGDDVVFAIGMTLIYIDVIMKLLLKKINGINIKNEQSYIFLKNNFKVLIFNDEEYKNMSFNNFDKFIEINNILKNNDIYKKIDFLLLGTNKKIVNKKEILDMMYKTKKSSVIDIFRQM